MSRFKKIIDLDFETKSEVNIMDVGAWVYSEHKSTEILLMRWSVEDGKIYPWRIGDKLPKMLSKLLKKGYSIRAHNSFFEYCIWNHVGVKKLRWPEVPIEKFICTQANVCAHSYSPKLEMSGEQLGLPIQKDKEGARLIQKFSVPRRAKTGPKWNTPEDHPIEFNKFDKYCKTDVQVQKDIARRLPPLSKFEKKVFLLTETMNLRGVPIDVPMVKGAIDIIENYTEYANKEAISIVGEGVFESVTQREKVRVWLCENGCKTPNMQKATLERKLKNPKGKIPAKALRIIELRLQVSKSSTAKYYTAITRLGKDQCVHETVKYHIAQTGRWGGRGLQIQNFVRPTLPKYTDYDYLCELISKKNIKAIDTLYGNVMTALSSALRSMICAPKGMKLICADYAQIEARIIFWFAGEKGALNIFKADGDVYVDMACDIYGEVAENITEFMRFIGKQCILGLGFGMGDVKFKADLYEKGDVVVPIESTRKWVKLYRKKYKKVRDLWYESEDAAIKAVQNKGYKFYCANKKIYYICMHDYLYCVLPSGRKITYVSPRIKMEPDRFNKKKLVPKLFYMTVENYKWQEVSTYGGKLFQHYVQGTARDVMAYGMLNAEDAGYNQIITAHDESVAQVDKNFGSVKHYEAVLSKTPGWAKGIPVKAEGWEGKRYRK